MSDVLAKTSDPLDLGKQGVPGLIQCLFRRGVRLIAARDSSMSALVGMVERVVDRTVDGRQAMTIVMTGGAEFTYGVNEPVHVQCDYDPRIRGFDGAIAREVLVSARCIDGSRDAGVPNDLYILVCGADAHNQPLLEATEAKRAAATHRQKLMGATVADAIISADGNSIAAIRLRTTEGESDLMVSSKAQPSAGLAVRDVFRR